MLNIKKSLLAGSAVLAMGVSSAALAAYGLPEAPAPVYNWYVGGFGGLTYTPCMGGDNGICFNNPNWNIGAHFGYRLDPVRLELEYMYQRSEFEGPFYFDGFPSNDVSGHASVNAALANVIYDINVESLFSASVTPYVGFGIGYANLDATVSASFTDNDGITRTGSVSGDSVSRFGYQALAGIGFKVMDNAMFTIGYRYFGTTHCDNIERFSNHKFDVGFDYYFM